MTSVTIQLPDQQAAALMAKATAQGMTLEEWVQELATQKADELASPPQTVQEAIARIRELQQHVKPDPEGWTVRDYINYGRS